MNGRGDEVLDLAKTNLLPVALKRDQPRFADGKGSRSWRRWKRCECSTMPMSTARDEAERHQEMRQLLRRDEGNAMSEISHSAANTSPRNRCVGSADSRTRR